ncbi:MAG TPA: methyltransferase domain-containing protein [Xanthobacteraceae bacterium]|nr:methyltransferase domain-containing protein [Xanthobacteraceae bacterium]
MSNPRSGNPPAIFDRALLRARRRRATSHGNENFLLERAAGDLAERLRAVTRRFDLALDLGTPNSALRDALSASGQIGTTVAAEPLASPRANAGLALAADEEALPFRDESFDLVVSALALHWVNDLPGTLLQIRRALKPDGLFLAVLAGGETLTELRQSLAAAESEIEGGLSPRVAPFVEVRAMGTLLQRAGFALPVTDVDRLTVRYRDLGGLFRDLRAMGATNALAERSGKPLRRETVSRTAEIYAERFADADGRLRATFDLLWVSGWAPHESQQQALKPGSAKMRLADALGTKERSAGERVTRPAKT